MPNFQSGINQLLGMGAIFSQLPGGQAIADRSQWKSDWKKLEGTEKKLGLTKLNKEGHHEIQPITSEQQAKQAELIAGQRQRFLNVASEQGGRNLYPGAIQGQISNMDKIKAYQNALNLYRGINPEQAMAHMQEIGQQQLIQRQNFGNLRSSLSPEERREALEMAGRSFV